MDLNHLQTLPESIGRLNKLETLSVYGNYLTDLPYSIQNLTSLKKINVGRNRMLRIRGELALCSALEELDFMNNELITLPLELAQLKNVKVLNVENNMIKSIPEDIFKGWFSLHTFKVDGNHLPPKVLQQMAGYIEFEARRRSNFDALISSKTDDAEMEHKAINLVEDLKSV
eukprot:CAMPEP_0175043730 /NCGR_PEP_ID=MMETSP0052_2-20121109/3371_1 /TAXON_ID=51329 ORGANISM="Polytomella parva, Strain SAG 63-3" /NCGR_SAMPLE_ID=MMETSP0052_2 /ASSEMBLY_ACC=CAM_ASM_000194 /LENGTH=171 /DNA_ID=CAMNT_0016306865 /DNA_START=405 /DNA_END=920 /DNA_ORIENTATION=-